MDEGELSDVMLLMLMVLNMMMKIVMETLPSKHTSEQESEDF